MALLAGCHSVPSVVASHRRQWQSRRSRAYEYTLTADAMCGVVRFDISVEGSRIAKWTLAQRACLVDPAKPQTMSGAFAPRTIDGVFDELASNYRHGYGMKVAYDSAFGFPTQVGVDANPNAIDDEYGYGVSNYRPLSS